MIADRGLFADDLRDIAQRGRGVARHADLPLREHRRVPARGTARARWSTSTTPVSTRPAAETGPVPLQASSSTASSPTTPAPRSTGGCGWTSGALSAHDQPYADWQPQRLRAVAPRHRRALILDRGRLTSRPGRRPRAWPVRTSWPCFDGLAAQAFLPRVEIGPANALLHLTNGDRPGDSRSADPRRTGPRDGRDSPPTRPDRRSSRSARHRPIACPGPLYTLADAFATDLAAVFDRSWLFVAAEPELPEPGDYVTVEIGRRSIILVRDDDMTVRAFHNVCRHRGSRLLDDACGTVGNIVCPYHQWTYDTRRQPAARRVDSRRTSTAPLPAAHGARPHRRPD